MTEKSSIDAEIDVADLSFDAFDELVNPPPATTDFDAVADRALSRRGFLGGSMAAGALAFVGGNGVIGMHSAFAASRLGFEAVAANGNDTITLPKGYSWQIVARWGDPMWSTGVPFDHKTRGTGASQELAFGDNNDGMELFTNGTNTVLAVNNEYTNLRIMFGNRPKRRPQTADDIRKCKAAHGVSIIEIAKTGGKWGIVKDSKFNRRITPDTEMEITGPARGHELLKTKADPSGTNALGTWNNCGGGRTPWGTYLTCEENFNGYFSSSAASFKPSDALKRYGIKGRDYGYSWASADERFDVSKHPNEVNRAGYVVEIDPLNKDSKPKKRTALGRFKHENAAVTIAKGGQVVVYLGDDERGEYLYRFVSAEKYTEGGDNSKLLETGRLYVARFEDNLTGKWIELTPAASGMKSAAEVCVYTRMAASAVNGTTMDRPEWVAVNPLKAEAYCCLTKNKNRGKKPNMGGDPTPVGGPNPRKANKYGQIVRWTPANGDHAANDFTWTLYVTAGNPTVHKDDRKGSTNVTAQNMFNAPDGLAFDSRGLLWIQTDGNYTNKGDFAGMGNNQMLVGDPETGEIKRFMVGPNECEVTGIAWSPDKRTLFVGIQHPGEKGKGRSHFPEGGANLPRSTVVAITRNDGGVIG